MDDGEGLPSRWNTLRAMGVLRFSAADYQTYAAEHPDWAFLAGIPDLRDLTWIDLPTSHWPMWSKPAELARIIGDIAARAASA